MVRGFERAEREYESRMDREGCTCEPKVVWVEEVEPNVYDAQYNCEDCDCEDCEYWQEYNKEGK